jgi:hypothetical protein
MKKLVATREVWYASKKYDAGDEFETSDIDAVILTAHDVGGGARAKYKTADIKPADPAVEIEATPVASEDDGEDHSEPKRRYRRRDMAAEE